MAKLKNKKRNKISLALNELNNIILSFLKKKRLNKNINQLKRFWGKTTTLICLYKAHLNIN